MSKYVILLLFLSLLINPCLASTYVIYYPSDEEIVDQYGFIDKNDIHINIHTKHTLTKDNYKYSKFIHNINTNDKFIILPDKNTNTLYVEIINNG